MAAWNLLQI